MERLSTELSASPGFHLAFSAPTKDAVNEWHKQALRWVARARESLKSGQISGQTTSLLISLTQAVRK